MKKELVVLVVAAIAAVLSLSYNHTPQTSLSPDGTNPWDLGIPMPGGGGGVGEALLCIVPGGITTQDCSSLKKSCDWYATESDKKQDECDALAASDHCKELTLAADKKEQACNRCLGSIWGSETKCADICDAAKYARQRANWACAGPGSSCFYQLWELNCWQNRYCDEYKRRCASVLAQP